MHYIIIAGSRTFDDYDLLARKMDHLTQNLDEIEVVSGGARGADELGERWARERGHQLRIFPADWNRFGRQAGFTRNAEMAGYATHLVAFFDGSSAGTKHMIQLAKKYNLKLRIIHFRRQS